MSVYCQFYDPHRTSFCLRRKEANSIPHKIFSHFYGETKIVPSGGTDQAKLLLAEETWHTSLRYESFSTRDVFIQIRIPQGDL